VIAPDNELEISALEADRGSFLGYVRLAGRHRAQTDLADHIVSVPAEIAIWFSALRRQTGDSLRKATVGLAMKQGRAFEENTKEEIFKAPLN
jgi:hypothetical protein